MKCLPSFEAALKSIFIFVQEHHILKVLFLVPLAEVIGLLSKRLLFLDY